MDGGISKKRKTTTTSPKSKIESDDPQTRNIHQLFLESRSALDDYVSVK